MPNQIYRPVVLVLLATHNPSRWITQQIDSILRQKYVTVKILIRDDDSSINSKKILKGLESKYDAVSIIYADKASGSAGANFMQLIFSSNLDSIDYVAFCDQDDIWFNDKLIISIKNLELSSSVGFSSSALAFWSNGRKKLITQSSKVRACDFLFEGAGQGCTFLVSKIAFKKIKLFCIKNKKNINGFFYHDWLVYLLVRAWDGKWFFYKNPLIHYRQHQNNETGSRGTFSSAMKRFDKIKNGWYKRQISIALRIYFLSTNQKNDIFFNFSKFFNKKDSFKRRLLMAKFVWLHGRRRFSDRFVLILASILGYI
jgi:rhamnosyltransferase